MHAFVFRRSPRPTRRTVVYRSDGTATMGGALPAAPPSLPMPARAASVDLAGLEPLQVARRRWPAIAGAVLTLAMTAALAHALFGAGLAGLGRAIPHDWRFYPVFAAVYLALPTGDFIIFRRLWRLPPAGFVALLKKRIANEVLFGYSGEAYFYVWARARAAAVAAPFGAVKDVSILSAIAGNALTLVTVAVALPLGHALLSPATVRTILVAAALTAAMSLPFVLFARRVFTLPRPMLRWILAVHVARLVAGSLLLALAWHLALPAVSLAMWLLLAAGRLLVSRLPVPNKDLLFAALAVVLIGRGHAVAELIAFGAALTLLIHVVLIAVFGVAAAARGTQAWQA